MGIEWRSPGRIKYRIDDFIFILSHYSEIELGDWPPEVKVCSKCQGKGWFEEKGVRKPCYVCQGTGDVKPSGYTDAPISKRKMFYRASTEAILIIAAVVDMKLKPCGFDGELAKELYNGTYCDDGFLFKRFEELEKKYGLSQDAIQDKTDCAIAFASSQTQTYEGFKGRFYKRRYKGD